MRTRVCWGGQSASFWSPLKTFILPSYGWLILPHMHKLPNSNFLISSNVSDWNDVSRKWHKVRNRIDPLRLLSPIEQLLPCEPQCDGENKKIGEKVSHKPKNANGSIKLEIWGASPAFSDIRQCIHMQAAEWFLFWIHQYANQEGQSSGWLSLLCSLSTEKFDLQYCNGQENGENCSLLDWLVIGDQIEISRWGPYRS